MRNLVGLLLAVVLAAGAATLVTPGQCEPGASLDARALGKRGATFQIR